ncbi:Elongation factor 1-beta [Armadillidium vulgare]|nr:Elongation factor 1-beta [Armadillidium vulgare]
MISLLSDLTTEEGLKALNEYLKDKSYMHGYCVSQSDITVFISIKQSLDPKLYPHLHRWHKHIKVVGGDITKTPNFIKHEGQECKILKENISYKSPKKEQAMKT